MLLDIGLILCSVFIIQCLMLMCTHTKRWSNHAFIRNLLIGFCIVYQKDFGYKIWLLPIIAEIIIEWLNFNSTFKLDNLSLETDYLYSDFFEAFTSKNQTIRYYTEGDFSRIDKKFPDTTDLSRGNIDRIMQFGEKEINKLYSNEEIDTIMDESQVKKYDWITEKLGIQPGHKILEIGFGKGDFLKYLRDKNFDVSGISISIEQVTQLKSEGYDVYHIDFWNLPFHPQLLNRFDAVIMNGCTEYLVTWDKEKNLYKKVFHIVKSLINKESPIRKVAITCIHHQHNLSNQPNLYNKWMQYFIMLGNGMSTAPIGENGLTEYAMQEKMTILVKENRVMDYYLYSRLMSCMYNRDKRNIALKLLLRSLPLLIVHPHFLHNIYAYTGFGFLKSPWNWQFTKQNNYYIPSNHYWLILQA